MRSNSTYNSSWIIIFAIAIFMSFAFSDAMSFQKADTTYLHIFRSKTSKSKTGLHLVLPPIKPAYISTTKISVPKSDDKLLNNVQVYPNPVTDHISLKYELSRNSNVSIKIMDLLGNDIITLFNQRSEAGEKNFNYPLNNKLNRGFYFVRIVAGTESVIKRISVVDL